MNAKRRARESQAARPEVSAGESEPWRDLVPLLDRELARLPEKYRAAVVLCELEGRSRAEASGLLGVSEGTLSSRLATARKLLARRLSRSGATVSLGALALALSGGAAPAAVPAPLVEAAVGAAWGRAADDVLTLTNGVMKAMFLERLKLFGLSLLAVALLAGGALVYAAQAGKTDADPRKGEGPVVAAGKKDEPGAAPEKKAGPAKETTIRPGDRLRIRVADTLPNNPIDGVYRVEETGKVPLGMPYGRVPVSGLTVEEAEKAVRDRLSQLLRNPQVFLTRYDAEAAADLTRRVERLEKQVQALQKAVEGLRKERRP